MSRIVILRLGVLSALLWAGDLLVRHWIAALDKSKFAPNFPAPRHQSLDCVQHGRGVKCVAIGIPARGNRSQMEFTARYDGREFR